MHFPIRRNDGFCDRDFIAVRFGTSLLVYGKSHWWNDRINCWTFAVINNILAKYPLEEFNVNKEGEEV